MVAQAGPGAALVIALRAGQGSLVIMSLHVVPQSLLGITRVIADGTGQLLSIFMHFLVAGKLSAGTADITALITEERLMPVTVTSEFFAVCTLEVTFVALQHLPILVCFQMLFQIFIRGVRGLAHRTGENTFKGVCLLVNSQPVLPVAGERANVTAEKLVRVMCSHVSFHVIPSLECLFTLLTLEWLNIRVSQLVALKHCFSNSNVPTLKADVCRF